MTVIRHRQDTSINWYNVNPILNEGEIGVETDTNKFKIGDGVTSWRDLAYPMPTKTSQLTNDSGFINLAQIPTKTSQLTNDSGFLTEHQDISGKADKATTLAGYGITNAYTKAEIDGKLSGAMKYKGTVQTPSDLPVNPEIGDTYNVDETGANYAWNGTNWDKLSENIDLSDYARLEDVPTMLSDLTNDTGFITISALNGYAKSSEIPTATSDLINDSGFVNSSVLSSYATKTDLNGKQDKIVDLTDIRNGASAGATALQSGDNISELVNDSNFATTSQIPTNNNQLTNGAGYITASALDNYVPLSSQDDIEIQANTINFSTYGGKVTVESSPVLVQGSNPLSEYNESNFNVDYSMLEYYDGHGNRLFYSEPDGSGFWVRDYNSGIYPDYFNTQFNIDGIYIDTHKNGTGASVSITVPSNGTLAIDGDNIVTSSNLSTTLANYVNTTDLATKVSKSGDTMTGDLEINKSIYLTSVAATAADSASKLYFGPKSSPYNYMAANTSGVFGIYNSSGKGIGCYPTQNLFPTNNIDLGRSNNKWKDIYASGKLYGASTNISITNLISGATLGATAIQPNDNISTLTNDTGYITSASLPTVNDATLTIQKNSSNVGTFTANASVDNIINITVPVNASDVNALSDSTLYGSSIDVSLNTTDYKLTITLKDQNGDTLNSKVVDFPIESVVVNGSYDSTNQKIVLTLQNGNTIDIPVGALIAGLQTEITSANKLDADLVDDSTSTNKFVTSNDKTTWNGKQDAISDLSTIRSNATNGQSAYTTINGYGNIVTHNVSEFATASQGLLADSALQPNDNISELNNDAGYITSASLPTVNNSSIVFQKNGTGFDTITLNQANNDTINISVPTQTSELTNNSGFITASALDGYATENFVTSQGYITGIDESDVLDALGYTPYNASNPDGFISGITSSDVITALGYTPYNSTNPSGYQANVIESIKVNNTTQTVVNKAVNITVPTTAAEVGALPDTTTINDLTSAAQQAALNSGANTTNIGQIATNTSNISSLSNTVTSNYNTLDGRITSEVNTLNGAITGEATNRQNADNALQTQIDAITSASDVFDIVGTYAELQAYDISTVPVNDIIKVLVDSTHNNAATYYRCVENNNVKSWSYIGAEGAYYTKSEADNKFVEQTITVNGQPLSSNVTLTASDVGALPSSTTIGAGVLTIQKNGTNVDTFSANATSNKTINITVPTDTNDLTNGAGFITSGALTGYATETWVSNQGYLTAITSSDVTAALGYTPYNSTNPDGYITAADLPTNYVTTDTAQNISGRKTFLGEKAIYFKQSAAADKLGFTLYNASSAELGALEWRPNTINGNALFNLNCSQSGSNYVGFRYWSGINIVAPRPTTNGNYFIPTHITNGTLTVTSDNKGTVNISTLLPDVSNFVTNTSLATTLSDYQPLLVSGSNIKTINNTSLLGSGNIDTNSVFLAQQNVTLYGVISDAIANNKFVYLRTSAHSRYLPLFQDTGTEYIFTNFEYDTLWVISVDYNNNWTTSTYNIANTDLSNLSATGQAVIDGKANTSLSNLSSTGKTVLDGQWVAVNTTLANAVSLNGSSNLTYTLSLPDSTYKYEVLLDLQIETGSTSGNRLNGSVSTDIVSDIVLCSCRTRTASTMQSAGSAIVPVSTSHKVYLLRNSNYNGTATLRFKGYRRIGTNS